MKLKPLASNMTSLTFDKDGERHEILFSYETPVAARILSSDGMTYVKTDKRWSVTTSRHINKFLPTGDDINTIEMPQAYFDNLISEVK